MRSMMESGNICIMLIAKSIGDNHSCCSAFRLVARHRFRILKVGHHKSKIHRKSINLREMNTVVHELRKRTYESINSC